MRRFLVTVSIFFILASSAYGRILELEDYLYLTRVAQPQIAPDGKKILYSRSHVDQLADSWVSELWLMDSDGGNNRYFADGNNPQWSPKSDKIAFTRYGDGEYEIVTKAVEGKDETKTIVTTSHRIRSLRWAPDATSIAFVATVPMQEPWPIELPGRLDRATWTENPLIVERLNYRIDGEGVKTGFDHIFIATASGGNFRQLTDGQWDVGARAAGLNSRSRLEWGPDSSTLFFDGLIGEESVGMSSNIYRLDIDSGGIEQLTRSNGFWSSPRLSPDGRHLAYIGYKGATPDQTTYPGYQIRVMDVHGSDDRSILENWEGRIFTQVAAVADFFEWRSDSRSIYVTRYANGTTNLATISLEGQVRSVLDRKYGFDVSSIDSEGVAVGTVATPHSPTDIAIASLDSARVTKLTRANEELLKNIDLGEVEEVWYDSDAGVRVQGWIVKPPGFDESKKYPLVLSIHGGPHSMYRPLFDFSFQDFAARGYVVLFANPRGSLGYGIEFANAVNNSISGDEAFNDLMAGVDAVVERGFIDEDRMNVTGCSAGGLMTNWIVTQTDRFRAAAARCSISNWISLAGTSDIVVGAHHFFDERFWDDPKSWWEHSPITHVANVTTPTLLMTGAEDLRTPIAQAEEFYVALRMRGIPTKLISMKGERHGTGRVPSNFLRTQLYLQKWFDENGGGPD